MKIILKLCGYDIKSELHDYNISLISKLKIITLLKNLLILINIIKKNIKTDSKINNFK